jgi:Fur family ferric uptake transcriptional regulator
MHADTATILKRHNLRKTNSRTDILSIFLRDDFALAHSDIEHHMQDNYDRVTIYRTLKTFVDSGLIHKVLDDEGSTKYALCKENCSIEEHDHEHVHFKCIKCGNTHCIEKLHVPPLTLPEGYQKIESSLLVQGVCPQCNN